MKLMNSSLCNRISIDHTLKDSDHMFLNYSLWNKGMKTIKELFKILIRVEIEKREFLV